MAEHYDVIIIGTGAGGGTLANTLADSGKRILLLERGDFLPREMENWTPAPVFIDGRYISDETWYDADGKAFQPQVHYFVGGATKLYGAALYRLRPQDFGELKHVDGVSPAWPVTYDDFEPFYTKAEWLYQVHGNHGEDPTEGAWSKQYPWPAVSHEPRIQQLVRRPGEGGLPPVPRAVRDPLRRSRPSEEHVHPVHVVRRLPVPRAREVRRRDDRGAPDPRPAERDAARRRRGHASSRPTPSGRTVTGVVVVTRRQARRRTRPTSSWCRRARRTAPSSCLQSANDKHPNGLANGSDQVGRNYMFHNSKAVVALSKERNDTTFQKTLGVNDFYFGADDYQWPIGNIQMVGKSNAEAMKGEEPKLTKLAPHWSLADVAHHAVDFWLTTEDLPKPDNRVTLASDGNVQLAYKSTNDEEADRLYHELKKILNHIGIADHHVLDKNFYMNMNIPVAGCAHQAGTVPLRERPGDLGARRELPRPRGRQPLRRRHELLPEHRRGEPGAHRDGERDPRRRAPARPTGLTPVPGRLAALARRAGRMHDCSAVEPGAVGARRRWRSRSAFHIILVPLGVSWAFMTLIANYRAIKRDDADALLLAQRWSKYMAVTFAVGAVTGTVLTFEFGLLWPKFMGRFGAAFGIPFAIEGLFFFLEAIFIAIYIYGWKRLKPWPHFWTGVPIVIAGIGGTRVGRRRERVDERAGRLHARTRRARSSTSTRWR